MVPLLLFLCAALARGSEQQQLQKAVRSTNLRRTSGSTIGTLSTAVAVGAVTKLRLINADTNLPIAGYNPLPAVSRIDLNTLPTPNLSVEALTSGNANGTVVASITWRFESIVRTENAAPWAMCLNNGADIYACRRLVVGFNSSISATPFTQGSGRGVSGTTVSIHLSLFRGNSPTKAPISVAVPTKAPTTNVPVTVAPKTSAPITAAPMATKSPTTGAPATTAPVTSAPKSLAPVTAAPVTNAPMTSAPITAAPLTKAPTTSAPITKAPVAPVPTKSPVKDIEPPKLLDLTLGEQALNVLLGPRSVVVTLKVKDNQSGIKSAVVGPVGYQQTYLVPTGVNTASGVLEFNVTLTFPPSAALEAWGTQYYIDVRLTDNAGNTGRLDGFFDVRTMGFPYVVNVNKFLTVLNMTALSPTTVDVSNGQAVNVTFEITVLSGGMSVANMHARNTKWALDSVVTRFLNNNGPSIQTFTVAMPVPAFIQPGAYPLSLELYDYDRRSATYGDWRLANQTFPSVINVINTVVDTTPPELLNLTVYDQSNSTKVNIEMTFRDLQAGVIRASIILSRSSDLQHINQHAYWNDQPRKGVSTILFSIDKDSIQQPTGRSFSFLVYLVDKFYNAATFNAQNLTDRGFPGGFTIL